MASAPALGDIVSALQKEQVGSEITAAEIQERIILVRCIFTAALPNNYG